MNKYLLSRGIVKSLKTIVVFLIAGLIAGLTPDIKELTIGGALILILNYLKVRWGVKIPLIEK
ncbi:MAG: hypothetical protein WC288_01910 [Candidatus Paceibacterota bacterium]|jgi:hypothetical protein